jgi:hypothetical protein
LAVNKLEEKGKKHLKPLQKKGTLNWEQGTDKKHSFAPV